jgi:hypothetical protein
MNHPSPLEGDGIMRKLVTGGLLVAGLFILSSGNAFAGRIPSVRNPGTRNPGVRGDMSVPYLTTGNTAFMTTSYVAPRIIESPQLDNPNRPAVLPTFNLQYWGGVQGIGNDFNGSVPRIRSDFPLWSPRFYLFYRYNGL